TSAFNDHGPPELRIRIQGYRGKFATIHVPAQPGLNIATIHLVLKQALKEADGQYALLRQEAEWAWRMMKKLGLSGTHIRQELRGVPELANHPELTSSNESRHSTIEDDLGDSGDNDLNHGLRDKAQEMEARY
ncbi:hypothetical protein KCU97_g8493, partial [Aureobasidium melanogenum]